MKARSINKSFLRSLRNQVGRRQFTTVYAEKVYHYFHWRTYKWQELEKFLNVGQPDRPMTVGEKREWVRKQEMDNWGAMSARNTLCAAVQHGMLKRVRRGVYRF